MIEVTCGACGNTLRLAEADVPPGGKTVPCTRCQAQVKVAPPPALGGATGDVINLADLPAPKRQSPLAGAVPKPPRPPTPPPLGGRGLSAPKPMSTPLPKVP